MEPKVRGARCAVQPSQQLTLEASAAALRERFNGAEILEGEATQLDIDRANLKGRLQEDHHERKAILVIADAINELYEDRTGRFVIQATENDPEFRISIEVGDDCVADTMSLW